MWTKSMANCIISKLVTHFEALQKASEDLRQSGTDGEMMRLAGNRSLSIIGRMLGFDTWITLYNSVSSRMRRNNNEKEMCIYLLYLRSVDQNKQASLLSERPGYPEAKEQ